MRHSLCQLLAALALGLTLMTAAHAAPAPVDYDVHAYGATGDGKTSDTDAINRAIDAAAAAGGGTVRFPPGMYLSGSIHLRSNITLYLGQGATIIGGATTDGVTYDAPEDNLAAKDYQDFGHTHWHNSLIWGENLHDIAILGPGRLWGRGLLRTDTQPDGQGNKTISLKLCRGVTLRDFTIQHGGWFGILATGVDNFTIDNLKIDTNRDGMDIDCCRQVRVSNCSVNSPQDDGICLKSSFGLGYARATEQVTITNCGVSGYQEGSLLDGTYLHSGVMGARPIGRIKFGTESNGGFKNITISNCTFDYCRGLALETVDGALLEDVAISNITMRDIVNSPIFLRLGRRMRGPAGVPVGELRRVTLSHITVYNADPLSCSIISGVPGHNIQDVTLSDIHLWYAGGGTKEQAALTPKESETGYPEPGTFGPMPAYAFFIRHVQGITLDNITARFLTDDQRPAFTLTDVTDADFQQVKAQTLTGTPVIAQTGVTGLRLRQVDGMADTIETH